MSTKNSSRTETLHRVYLRRDALIKSGLTFSDALKQAWAEIKAQDNSNKMVLPQTSKIFAKPTTPLIAKATEKPQKYTTAQQPQPVKSINTEYSPAWEKGDKDATRFFVYILKLDGDTTFYVGHTRDLRARLFEHKNASDSPIKHLNPKLQYFEILSDRTTARIRESELKTTRDSNPRTIIQMIIDFKDLSLELNYE